MSYFYADSSVLVKRHITETGSAWVQQLTEIRSNVIATSRVSWTARMLVRATHAVAAPPHHSDRQDHHTGAPWDRP